MKIIRIIRLLNVAFFFVGILMLSGGITLNPGPLDLTEPDGPKGISFCQWNVQHLKDAKFEQILQFFINHNETPNNLGILILRPLVLINFPITFIKYPTTR